jgi:hypothetical protein
MVTKFKKLLVFLLVFGLISTVYAETFKIRKFSGLNTRMSPLEIKDNETPSCSNFVLDTAGVLTERNLFKHYNTTTLGTQPVSEVYKFYKSSDVGYLLCVSNGIPYSATAGVLTSREVTDATVTTTTAVWDFETFTDGTDELCYAASNDHYLMRWNGTDDNFVQLGDAGSDGGMSPAEKLNILKKHKSRLFGAGSTTYPYRLYYSSLSNGDDWVNTGGTIDLPSYEKIITLEKLSDILYIYTRTSIYALLGDTPNEFTLQKTRSTVGTHAAKSVVLANKLHIFLNKAGVFAFDGDSSVNISEGIQPTIDAISNVYLDEATGLYDNRGRYWLAYTSRNGIYNDTILIYDTVIKQWYPLSGNFQSFFKTEGGTDKGELFAGASDDTGWLWQLQVAAIDEQISHSTRTHLESGVTFNTVFGGTEASPIVRLQRKEHIADGDVKLLMHFDADPFLDSSTANNKGDASETADVDLDADVVEVGYGSADFDGDSGFLQYGDSDDWDFVDSISNDQTIDFWVKHTSAEPGNNETYITHYEDGSNQWLLRRSSTEAIEFFVVSNNITVVTVQTAADAINDTDWHHIALCRVANEYGIYIDGIQKAYVSDFNVDTFAANLYIGRSGAAVNYMDGNIDELRIPHSNIFGAAPNSGKTDTITVPSYVSGGTLTSDNLEIGASGQTSLGAIKWNENLPTDTDIQFTTRTGVTDDTSYDTWTEPWVSASSVSIHTVTGDTSWTTLTGSDIFEVTSATTTHIRDVTYYEADDEPNPDCLEFTVGADIFSVLESKGHVSAATTIAEVDISDKKFIGFWLKSPITGSSVRISMGEVTGSTVAEVTADTANIDTWEKHWWAIDGYTDTDIDEIKYLQLDYIGESKDTTRVFYLDEMWAYDFLDSSETITSTPDDFIQYRAILGTSDTGTPKLIELNNLVVSLSYSIAGAVTESELVSTWKSKVFDFQTSATKFFNWVEFTLETQNPTTGNIVYIDYDIDDGEISGTVSDTTVVTGQRAKLKFYFPSGTSGEEIQITLRDEDLDSDLEIHNLSDFRYFVGGN